MEPSHKRIEMAEFLDRMTEEQFGRSRTDSIKKNVCVACGMSVTHFRDPLSQKEYTISGLCQACQDEVFGV